MFFCSHRTARKMKIRRRKDIFKLRSTHCVMFTPIFRFTPASRLPDKVTCKTQAGNGTQKGGCEWEFEGELAHIACKRNDDVLFSCTRKSHNKQKQRVLSDYVGTETS